MKIGGKVPGVNRGVIEFHRPNGQVFRLAVQAAPYGFPEKVERELPLPDPPVEYARDPKSGAVLRDEAGMAAKTERRSDPRWRKESARVRALRVILQAREALRGDPSVQFEADEHAGKLALRACAEAIEKEFADAGFSDLEIIAIFNKSYELNRGAQQRVDEAAEGFLSETPAEPDGGSPSEPEEAGST